jgi:hypothetical protein
MRVAGGKACESGRIKKSIRLVCVAAAAGERRDAGVLCVTAVTIE